MDEMYYEDEGVRGDSEEIEWLHTYNAHTYNEYLKCEHCDFRDEELMHLYGWMEDACGHGNEGDFAARETLRKLFELLKLRKCMQPPNAGPEF
jgi:hypothetical protein